MADEEKKQSFGAQLVEETKKLEAEITASIEKLYGFIPDATRIHITAAIEHLRAEARSLFHARMTAEANDGLEAPPALETVAGAGEDTAPAA